jgi:hypothetical protein
MIAFSGKPVRHPIPATDRIYRLECAGEDCGWWEGTDSLRAARSAARDHIRREEESDHYVMVMRHVEGWDAAA